MKKLLLIVISTIILHTLSFSVQVTGKVTDAATGEGLAGANVTVGGTALGGATDDNGYYNISGIEAGSYSVSASYIGYESGTNSVEVSSSDVTVNFSLAGSSIDVSSVSVIGSRFKPRTQITTAVPVDNLTIRDLKNTGQVTVEQMLTYRLPSYNSQQQTISDATAHFDPADLRGLGPSRTLVLINGKRKNASALVFINDTPGKGEVGVDMKSIPSAAIERIEVLRDGASAQYGSDAIAGVINIILKDDVDYTTVNFRSGSTTEGDGFSKGFDASTGIGIGSKGFLNLSASFYDQEETNRAGEPGGDGLFGVVFGDDAILNGTHPWLVDNPDMGMHVGMPNMTTNDVSYNYGYNLDERNKFYSFGSLTTRKSLSYALYRAPYWIPDANNIFHDEGEDYVGFQPTFESDVIDNNITAGVTGDKSGWNYDLSASSGSNSVDYTVDNSQNLDMGAESPTTFNPGGYEFRHTVTNFDLSKSLGMVTIGLGSEFRFENFVANAGEEASYYGGGVQSFPGIQSQNAVDVNRQNFGFYVDLGADINDDIYVGAAARSEEYSDFGTSFTWKGAGRYKTMNDRLSLRASMSTGFRAPSLHQIYMSNIQTLISGGTVSNQGTFNNHSPVVRSLGVEKLKEENATNSTFGLAFKPIDGLYLSLDMYNVAVDDRIVYSSAIGSDDTTSAVGAILNDYNVTSIKFFTNAVSSTTKGMDFVASYSGLEVGPGALDVSLSYNSNTTELGDKITTPTPISSSGADIFDRKEQSRLISARPSSKLILGLDYSMGNLSIGLNNTQFGEVTWQHASDASMDQTFSAKLVTDLNLNYQVSDNLSVNLALNNLLNVYPDVIDTKGDFVTDLGGRFKYPWEVNQFGFMGTNFMGTISYDF
jgi:iron complex outermembrane receptor protein